MTKIIQFPKADRSQYREVGERIIGHFKKFSEGVGNLLKYNALLPALASVGADERLLSVVHPERWAQCDYDVELNGNVKGYFEIETLFRELLVPEFPIQEIRTFLRWDYVASNIPSISKEMPDNIAHELMAYFAGFPSEPVANLIAFNYYFLMCLIERPGMRYISHKIEQGEFHLETQELIEGDYITHSYKAAYLPILLDGAAARLFEEQSSSKK